MSIVAQSFLFNIGLAGSTAAAGRVIAMHFSLVVGEAFLVVPLRHRQTEVFESEQVGKVEEHFFSCPVNGNQMGRNGVMLAQYVQR
jgi:hypothetical protein